MSLTAFENSILSIKGDYSREMKRHFVVDISDNNAKKQLTGMKRLRRIDILWEAHPELHSEL